jgi:two-component system, cell cycle sensor histidine kinase and response regulator CckA
MEASRAPSRQLPESDLAPTQRCILVVDDERTVLSVTARMLCGAGYSVLEATGAREALRLLAEDPSRVELVVTDVVMPETDGRALGRLIAERHPHVQVAYMSAYPAEDVLHRGSPGPGFTFLRKPFSAEALLSAVGKLIGT